MHTPTRRDFLGSALLVATSAAADALLPSAADAATRRLRRIAAYDWAHRQLGKPYQLGATGPRAFDCSGLVMMAHRHAGIHLPRTVADMVASGKLHRVHHHHARHGDLAVWGDYHVEFYCGHGWWTLGAETQGVGVYDNTSWKPTAFYRVAGADRRQKG